MSKTATFVKEWHNGVASQRLYRLSDSVTYDDDSKTDHIVVSATVAPFSGPETYIFPADSEGEIVDWLELDGSYRGGLSHEKALLDAGYTIQSSGD